MLYLQMVGMVAKVIDKGEKKKSSNRSSGCYSPIFEFDFP